jgi:RNA polymerase sigma-70 factor (ECF subfamily)
MEQIEQLYHEHGGALLAYLRRTFGKVESAEDMLHETFVQAMRHQDRLAQAVSARAWLFGIARHVGLTALRKNRPLQRIEEHHLSAPQCDSRLSNMREAIEKLSDVLRETLEFRLRDHLTYEEIALAMEIPVGTVRSRLHTAMQQLRTAMEDPQELSK